MSRTAHALEVLAQAVEIDAAGIADLVDEAAARAEAIASQRGANGFSSFMRRKATEFQTIADAVRSEAATKAAEYRGLAPRPVLVETVDAEKVEAVREARAAS